MGPIKDLIKKQPIEQKTELDLNQSKTDVSFKEIATEFMRLGYEHEKKIGRKFIIDDYNRKEIKMIIEYFLGIPNELNPHKGLLIQGNVGSGKSLIFELISYIMYRMPDNLKKKGYKIEYCEKISVKAKLEGEEFLYNFTNYNICFDDLGDEEIKKNYGDAINSMEVVIKDRHRIFRKNGLFTHFTTNLNDEQLEEMYGERGLSRLKEMCNFILLRGKDRRLN